MAAETEKTTVWSVAFVMEDKGSDELHTTTVLAGSRDIAIMAAAAELEIDASATKLVICKPF